MSFDSLEWYDLNLKQIRFAQVSRDKETTSMPAICYTPTKRLSLSLALLLHISRHHIYREVWGEVSFSHPCVTAERFLHITKRIKMSFSQQPLSIAPIAAYLSWLHIQGLRPSSSTHRSHISPGGNQKGWPRAHRSAPESQGTANLIPGGGLACYDCRYTQIWQAAVLGGLSL